MAKQIYPATTVQEIINALNGFGSGQLDVVINTTDDPQLNSIIEAVKTAARALQEQTVLENQFAVDAVGLGIWKFDPTTNLTEWDKGMFRLYDIDPKDFSGAYASWANSVDPEDLARVELDLQLALKGEKPFNTTFKVKLKNGQLRHIEARAVVVLNESGAPKKMYGVNWDVTEKFHSGVRLQENELIMSAILQALPVAVFGKDIQNEYRWNIWNKKAEDLFSIKAADCIGKSDADYFPKEQMESFRAADIAASKSTGIIDIPDETAQTPFGPISLHTRKVVIRDENGDPKILIGISENITEKKAREKRRIEQEMQLILITDSIPGPIARTDHEGRYVFVNKIYEDWYGIPREQILGKKPTDIIPAGFSLIAKPYIQRAKTGEKVSFEGPMELYDGRKLFIHVTLIPCINPDGRPDGFFTIVHDITAIKAAEAKLVHSSKLASLGEMSAGIAHEINNPLAIIAGSIGQLTKFASDPEKLAHKVETITRAVGRISKIMSGLKKFSRSAEKLTIDPHSLRDIAKEVLVLTASKSSRHDTPVTLFCTAAATINCDEVGIEQVLINLVNNAIDAVHNNEDRWVKVTIEDVEGSTVLRVIDSGGGIPKIVRDRLFQPFFTTKPTGMGTGLGLSITKGILDEHKATISVVAECPNTCFEIRFPKVEGITNAA